MIISNQSNEQSTSSTSSTTTTTTISPIGSEYARALHSFQPNPTSNTCLSFEQGEIIKTLNKDRSGWWDGELNGKRGWFPSNYVEILLVSSTNQGGQQQHEVGGRESRDWNQQQQQDNYSRPNYSNSRRASEVNSEETTSLSSSTRSLSISSSSNSNSNTRNQSISSNTSNSNNSGTNGDGGVLESIQQAITLLQNAVLSNRINHFQPSTACVISSVRTVLSSTDCLTRESKVLRRHPPLAFERKRILASLASLVNQARRASSSSSSSNNNGNGEGEGGRRTEEDRVEDCELMLSMAEEVSGNVNSFLTTAAKLGVRLAEKDRPSTSSTTSISSPTTTTTTTTTATPYYNDDSQYEAGRDRDRSGSLPGGPVSRSSITGGPDLRSARSLSDLRGGGGKRPELKAITGQSTSIASYSTTSPLSYQSSTGMNSPRGEGVGNSFSSYQINSSTATSTTSPHSSSSHQLYSTHNPTSPLLTSSTSSSSSSPLPTILLRTTSELNEILSLIHDQLLSTIAALIGHVHAHSRNSHSSSFAYLIDITRETIEKVREILIVVEAVSVHPSFRLLLSNSNSNVGDVEGDSKGEGEGEGEGDDGDERRKRRELETLGRCRETLYLATTALVTSARIATSAPSPSPPSLSSPTSLESTISQSGTGIIQQQQQEEEEERRNLLHSATAVLRSGGDCIGAVKVLLIGGFRVGGGGKREIYAGGNDLFELVLPDLVVVENNSTSSNSTMMGSNSSQQQQQQRQEQFSNRRSSNFDRVDEEGSSSYSSSNIERRGSNNSNKSSSSGTNGGAGGNRSGNKNPHTLSMLGRKATSLSCLRDMYEAGTPIGNGNGNGNGFDVVVEEEGEEEEEVYTLERQAEEEEEEEERRFRSSESIHSYQQQQQSQQSQQHLNSSRNNPTYSESGYRHSGRYSPENYNDDRRGKNGTPLPMSSSMSNQGRSRAMSATSSSETTVEITGASSNRGSPTNSISGRSSFYVKPTPPSASSPTVVTDFSSRSITSVPMSRGESSMTSESATSSNRSQMSRTSTTETSPRSSGTSTQADMNLISKLHGPFPPIITNRNGFIPPPPPLPSPNSPMYPLLPPTSSSSSPIASFNDGNAWFLERDYEAREISFNGDGHVTGGTLKCLIERMTLHDTTIDLTFSKTFFLTFRMFTNPVELSELLFRRFDISPPTPSSNSNSNSNNERLPMTQSEIQLWNESKATPVRLRIYNLFKTWVESYWHHETDNIIIPALIEFCKGRLAISMASASIRLIDLLQKRTVPTSTSPTSSTTPLVLESATTNSISPTTTTTATTATTVLPTTTTTTTTSRLRPLLRTKSSDKLGRIISPTGEPYPLTSTSIFNSIPPPPSILGKNLLAILRSSSSSNSHLTISISEIDPLELARQLTIMESRLYCRVKAGELLGQDISKKLSVAVNVRAMSTLSTRLTGWCAETILNEGDAKKRTGLIKYFIKLCDRCLSLNNYNTLMAVLCALNSSTISRLKKTWEGISSKYKLLLDVLRKATEHSRNYAEYRAKIRNAVPPCLPFLGLFLTDITFCYEGNPAERPSPVDSSLRLINFDRYQKMSKIVTDLQRFQQPYNLIEVPEIQNYLSRALDGLQHGGDVTSLYRQSLMLEPRAINDNNNHSYNPNSVTGRGGELFNWKS